MCIKGCNINLTWLAALKDKDRHSRFNATLEHGTWKKNIALRSKATSDITVITSSM